MPGDDRGLIRRRFRQLPPSRCTSLWHSTASKDFGELLFENESLLRSGACIRILKTINPEPIRRRRFPFHRNLHNLPRRPPSLSQLLANRFHCKSGRILGAFFCRFFPPSRSGSTFLRWPFSFSFSILPPFRLRWSIGMKFAIKGKCSAGFVIG